tara:strand:- start:649 stop:1410 length:762 start_codon:yes stop_codon:yes gene_type:complete
MLKVRIIPTLLYKDFGLVKGIGFDSWRRIGPVLPAVKIFNSREVDELIFLDITSTNKGINPDYEAISELSKFCFVPLTVGGGINSIEQVDKLIEIGADKVSINSASYENPQIISKVANRFGKQCVVASIDVRFENNEWICYKNSGLKRTNKTPLEWAKELESLGAGEILITSIERDGLMKGYDQELISLLTSNLRIPVIASGGAGPFNDLYLAVSKSKASALAAASIFQFTENTPNDIKNFLRTKDIPVRINL